MLVQKQFAHSQTLNPRHAFLNFEPIHRAIAMNRFSVVGQNASVTVNNGKKQVLVTPITSIANSGLRPPTGLQQIPTTPIASSFQNAAQSVTGTKGGGATLTEL